MQNWNENIFSFFFFFTVLLHKYSVNYLRNESISPRENYSKYEVERVCKIFSLYRAQCHNYEMISDRMRFPKCTRLDSVFGIDWLLWWR